MKWLVRIAAGVVIAFLGLTMFRAGGYARGNIFAVLIVLYLVARFEKIDVRNWWSDDDDDDQGPFRPA